MDNIYVRIFRAMDDYKARHQDTPTRLYLGRSEFVTATIMSEARWCMRGPISNEGDCDAVIYGLQVYVVPRGSRLVVA